MRVRIKSEDIFREGHQVRVFALNKIRRCDGSRVYMHEIFDAYKGWLHEHGFPDTQLSQDGFGRLFPTDIKRKVSKIGGRPAARVAYDVAIIEVQQC